MKNPNRAIDLNFVPQRSVRIKSYLLADGKCSVLKKKNNNEGFHAFLDQKHVSVWCLIDGTRSVKDICHQSQLRFKEVIILLEHFRQMKLTKT